MNLRAIWAVAATEMRLDRRLARTWVFIVVMVLFAFFTTLNVVNVYSMTSAVSSSTLLNSPLMLPYQLFPNLIFWLTLGVVFLAFDIRARDKRERVDEVVGVLPVSNLELVLGRATGITVLMSLPLLVVIIGYYVVGLISRFVWPDSGFIEPETYTTLAMLIIDLVPNILLWVALVMVITMVVRLRVIAALLALGVVGIWIWSQNNFPIYVLNIINSFSSAAFLPSFVAPTFTTSEILTHRLGMLLISFAFLCLAAALYPRLDKPNRPRLFVASSVLAVLSVCAFMLVSWQYRSEYVAQTEYANAHQPFADQTQFDIDAMTGTVNIDPGDDATINLVLTMHSIARIEAGEQLIFSLNPGYEISKLSWNGTPVDFDFNQGLLLIDAPEAIAASQETELTVEASGELDMRFAYLDSAVNVLASDIYAAFGLLFQGSQSGMNDSAYVAFVPALAWYPMPGSHMHRDLKHIRPRDFFELDLAVGIPSDWSVAGPGMAEIQDSGDSKAVSFLPIKPVHEVALFSAEFERRTKEISGIEFELLVTPASIRNVDMFQPILEDLVVEVEDLVDRATEKGLGYPYRAFTLVETPLNLRAYGGGWRMDTTQSFPGIFAIREGSFLQASFDAPFTELTLNTELAEEERREKKLAYLTRYFKNDTTGGNVFLAASDNLMQYQTDATGPGAIPLGYLLNFLARDLATDLEGFYSAHVSMSASSATVSTVGSLQQRNNPDGATMSRMYFDWYIDQPNVWEAMLANPLAATEYENVEDAESNLHVLHLWGHAMADLLRSWLGDDQLGVLLAEMRARYSGTSYTFADFDATAQELGIDLNEVLGDWLSQSNLAGFRASEVSTVRLPDIEYSVPQYESSFYVENAEPVAGLINVRYQMSESPDNLDNLIETQPIKIAGNSAVEIALITEDPLGYVRIDPYLSYNRSGFALNVQGRERYERIEREPKPPVQAVDWQYELGNAIVVDDLDQGFTVDQQPARTGMLGFASFMMSTAFGEPVLDQGLAAMDPGRVGFSFSFDAWSRQSIDQAYGKYRHTLARAFRGTSVSNAHFTASLPAAGDWKLEYHLPSARNRLGSGFNVSVGTGTSVRTTFGERANKWGNFEMWLTDGDRKVPLEMDGENVERGWNAIGEFALNNPTITVSVSTNTSTGIVVADAIRWTPAS